MVTDISLPTDYSVEDCFAAEVSDDGMSPILCEGDTVIAHIQDSVENGDIAVVSLDGQHFILRRVFAQADGTVVLEAYNPKYPPLICEDKSQVQVYGRVMSLIRELKAA